jgi:hypothetical protein
VLWLLLFLVLLAFVLAVVLWGGSLFGHSYFYTEIAAGLIWRAAVAAGILVLFYFCWSMINVAGGRPTTGELPYPEFWRFSNRIYMVDSPVPELTSKKRSGEAVYLLDKTQPRGTNYKLADGVENWSPSGVEWISLKHDGTEYKFDHVKGDDDAGYRRFVDKEHGWEMRDVEIGQPSYTSFPRLVVYFILNVLHLGLWIAVVWLVLRFSLPHAVVLAFILWLIFTVLVFPVLFANVQAAVRV